MMTGISTACLYPMYTEVALQTFASLHVEATEVFINCSEEILPAKLREMRSIADGNGVKILSLHPYTSGMEPMLFFSAYKRRFYEGMELYKKYYEAANILGADIVIFHGNSSKSGMSYDEYFNRFGRLVEDSISNGSKLCHENVSRCMSRSSAFFKELAKAVPQSEFVFDTKQAFRAGEDVFEFVKAMSGRIRHVHFSDHSEQNDCLVPGHGTFNTGEFLDLIKNNGFDGGVIVELYRENFDSIVELYEGYQRLFTQVSTQLKNDETNDKIRQSQS